MVYLSLCAFFFFFLFFFFQSTADIFDFIVGSLPTPTEASNTENPNGTHAQGDQGVSQTVRQSLGSDIIALSDYFVEQAALYFSGVHNQNSSNQPAVSMIKKNAGRLRNS